MNTILKSIMWIFVLALAATLLIGSLRLLLLKRDVSNFKNYWDRQTKSPLINDQILYVALGDSAAQGLGASRPENGYVGLIRQEISRKTGLPVKVINLSVSGARVKDVIDEQIPKLQQLSLPTGTVITLEIGANDLKSFKPETFKTEIDQLLSLLPPNTIVADVPYFGGSWARSRQPNAIAASNIINAAAASRDLRKAPLQKITMERDNIFVYGADLFHPNDKGYKNWFDAFQQALNQ